MYRPALFSRGIRTRYLISIKVSAKANLGSERASLLYGSDPVLS